MAVRPANRRDTDGVPRLRHRVYEPGIPRDLPLWLVQEWESEVRLDVGVEVAIAGERWRIAAVEADADPGYEARVYLELAATARAEPHADW